jgi:peroxiredoxin
MCVHSAQPQTSPLKPQTSQRWYHVGIPQQRRSKKSQIPSRKRHGYTPHPLVYPNTNSYLLQPTPFKPPQSNSHLNPVTSSGPTRANNREEEPKSPNTHPFATSERNSAPTSLFCFRRVDRRHDLPDNDSQPSDPFRHPLQSPDSRASIMNATQSTLLAKVILLTTTISAMVLFSERAQAQPQPKQEQAIDSRTDDRSKPDNEPTEAPTNAFEKVTAPPEASGNAVPTASKEQMAKMRTIEERLKEYELKFHEIDIVGRAVDESGEPIAGAKIYLASTNSLQMGEQVLAETISGTDGTYQFRKIWLPVLREPFRSPISVLQGQFEIFGTAAGYGYTWRGDYAYRPTERSTEPTGKLQVYFPGDKIETELEFAPEIILRGTVSDDEDRPVKNARIELGTTHVRGGQSWRCNFLESLASKRRIAGQSFNAIRSLPETLRVAHTDALGNYEFRGLPREANFLGHVYGGEDYEEKHLSVATTKEKLPNVESIGYRGKLDIVLKGPRNLKLQVTGSDAAQGMSGTTIRVRPEERGLKGPSTKADDQGFATLRLLPGKYTLIAEPQFGASYVITEKPITVQPQPKDQQQEITLAPGAIAEMEAVDAESGQGIAGVDFLVGNDIDATRRALSSQTVIVDHPVTDAEGKLQAIIAPGNYQFAIDTIPAGYEPVRKTSDSQKLVAGETTVVRFEFRQEAASATTKAAETVDNGIPRELIAKWQDQATLLQNGKAKIRLRRSSSPWPKRDDLAAILDHCDPTKVPDLEAIAKRDHPDADFRFSEVEILSDGRKFREHTYYWHGREQRGDSLMASNGKEAVYFNQINHQADVHHLRDFRIHAMSISELCHWPRFYQMRRPTSSQPEMKTTIEELGGVTKIILQGGKEPNLTTYVFKVDAATGFVVSESIDFSQQRGHDIWQFAPKAYPNGAILPGMQIEIKHQKGQINIFTVQKIEHLELGVPFPPDAFVLSAPAQTNVIDHRGGAPRNPKSRVAREAITDLVSYANTIPETRRSLTEIVKVGDQSPELKVVKWLNQEAETDAPQLAGKIVAVYFWDIGCGPCVANLPNVQEASKHYEGKDVVIVGVHGSWETADAVKAAVQKHGLTFPVAIDQQGPEGFYGATTAAFGVRAIPKVAIIDRNGILAYLGDWGQSLPTLEHLLQRNKSEVKE